MTETVYIQSDEGGEITVVVDNLEYSYQSGCFDVRASCPDEYYGYEDIEYEIQSITRTNEDGDVVEDDDLSWSESDRLDSELLTIARQNAVDDYDDYYDKGE